MDLEKAIEGLRAAGFTSDELRGIAADLLFAATVVEGTGEHLTIYAGRAVAWTPAKRKAWDALWDRTTDAN